MLIDSTVRNVVLGCLILGSVSGILGTFAVLRRQGLVGDTLAHAALPGVVIAFMLSGSKAPLILILGASVSGWIAMSLLSSALRTTRLDPGTVMAVVLSSTFGLGVALLSWLQKSPTASLAGLDKYLLGQAASLVSDQVAVMGILGAVCVILVALLFKEFKLLSFDPVFAKSTGWPVAILESVLTGLLLVSIVVGLNTVGVVLMSAMLVAPAVAARPWSRSLTGMTLGAAVVGSTCGLLGAGVSLTVPKVPTGPAIVVFLGVAVVASLVLRHERRARLPAWRRP
ncbi:MAG: metal ABC transporter permease [Fimbriimonadaceae bacterium]|nr:metal ABC transporter permease [Fimbriimonadaceae bacterium]QYK58819.1 MAG: metal ABC transporter permease [Fimbriimonadaceae bacterium]